MKVKASYKELANCEVKRMGLHMTTLSSDTNCKSGVPKTTLRFDNLLERLRELTESCGTHCIVYYRERIQVEISQRKRDIG